jgi:prepilin-type N-terminal cleavage/methylation domain-containing protein
MSSNQKGFSLIEMLITLSILSVVMLSLSLIQFKNTQNTGERYLEQLALNLIHNAYEQCQTSCETANLYLENTAPELLPEGKGNVIESPSNISFQISWFDRFSDTEHQIITDV